MEKLLDNYFPSKKDASASNIQILIADDCQFNIVAIRSLLEQFDCRCDFVYNGQKAIDAV